MTGLTTHDSDKLGIGFQINPTIFGSGYDFGQLEFDYLEMLCDYFGGPPDSGLLFEPGAREVLEHLRGRVPLVTHGNFGAEFGFTPLEEVRAVVRHVPIVRHVSPPWHSDHLFFGDVASAFMWSSPLQFSPREVQRVADRASRFQDLLGVPLLHENAFYYNTFPDSTISEAEFIAGFVEKAGTYLHLDLHNIYANSRNHRGYDPWRFLRTIPLERVWHIHIAGGEQIDDWYHDLHNHAVPEPVWELLEWVVPRATNLRGICLEMHGTYHMPRARDVDASWPAIAAADLRRARQIWTRHQGRAS